ncbi:MAG: cytochrome c [Defluviimonas sp.]|uniref:c-type cytochrome n=1 Tax=Albidovulum sp. TaxID=1872424 RepID=UPI002A2AF1A7|nr:cytochrome c [Defluviimonas sp.]
MRTILSGLAFVATASALTLSGAAQAQDAPFAGQIKARQGIMMYRAIQLGTLGAMAKGEVDYDAAAAQKAADNLLSAVTIDTSMLWPAGSDSAADPTSTALPDLWAEGAEVAPKGKAMVEAATAMQAEAGKGLDNLKAAMGAVGAACGGCHKAFRKPN